MPQLRCTERFSGTSAVYNPGYGRAVMMHIDQSHAPHRVDYCVTTMDRPHAVERLLLSVATHRPEASVHVADQSESVDQASYDRLAGRLEEAGLRERPTIHALPCDCGVSAARNHLIDSTPAEYKLILDDDFVFTERTDVDALVGLLDARPGAGVAGGSVIRGDRVRNVGTLLRKRGDSLHQQEAGGPFDEQAGIRFKRTDCVPMFALMRRALFEHVRWDPALKTAGEHLDFFFRIQRTPYDVLYAPDVTIDHPPIEADPSYVELRVRSEFLKQMLAKHNVRHLKVPNGTVFELLPDGEMTMYCELEREELGDGATPPA
jgi:GT2 family glycosyltransferase